jgi:hypothetical protein
VLVPEHPILPCPIDPFQALAPKLAVAQTPLLRVVVVGERLPERLPA